MEVWCVYDAVAGEFSSYCGLAGGSASSAMSCKYRDCGLCIYDSGVSNEQASERAYYDADYSHS